MVISVFLSLLRAPVRLMPDAVHTEVSACLLNHLLRGQTFAARLSELEGKTVGLHITDAASRLCWRIQQGGLRPATAVEPDVIICGTLVDFWQLATRSEDPDTLFFNRRLSIQGDTETGLHIKNLLDALDYDWEAHFRAVLGKPMGDVAVQLFRLLRPDQTTRIS
jgi:predicted lipid carrier protein YhbT